MTFDLENQKGSRFSLELSMYQAWSKSIEGCWFYSAHKDVTEERTEGSVTISLRNFIGERIKSFRDIIYVYEVSLYKPWLPHILNNNKQYFTCNGLWNIIVTVLLDSSVWSPGIYRCRWKGLMIVYLGASMSNNAGGVGIRKALVNIPGKQYQYICFKTNRFHHMFNFYSGTCLIRHTKGSKKCVGLYKMSEY